ncbi:MAG: hypothetical protein ACJAYG_001315 [Oceanicoccus sp.]|jgi:hypothetical protein
MLMKIKAIIFEYIYIITNNINPYSETENRHKLIFIHIPKTGGNAIIQSLFGHKATGHFFIEDYYKCNKLKYENFYKIAVTRNPYTRFISAFYYLKNDGIGKNDSMIWAETLKKYSTPDEFISELKVDSALFYNTINYIHFTPQYRFLENHGCKFTIDHIGQQENLEDSFSKIKLHLNLPNKTLTRHNTTQAHQKNLSDESKEFIYSIYKKDFISLGYNR